MAFPIADDNSDRTTFPWVTISLIVINVLVFVLLQQLGANDDFTYAWATVPAEIIQGKDLVFEPGEVQRLPVGPGGEMAEAQVPPLRETPSVYLTLLTAIFMHGSLLHLAGNMWFLWIFGDNIEHDMGHWLYIAFYLACGLLASLVHVALNASGVHAYIPVLGASGAISGVLGGYLVLHPKRRVTVLLIRFITHVPGWVAVGIWFAFQLINGLNLLGGGDSGVAYGAHIGGFIVGLGLALLFLLVRPPPTSKREWDEVIHSDRYDRQPPLRW
jgi:membrane associated rhomboid family serine protease